MAEFSLKSLQRALLLALGGACLSTPAHAVHVNPRGLGQALIYPYYTVRSDNGNAYDTYLSIANTTPATKALKVRFREGKNGRSVLDFNVYLARNDMWTGAIVPEGEGARLISNDKSCTTPTIPTTGFLFSNLSYTGTNTDNETEILDRVREGYFEVIEMGELTGTITTGIKHVMGVPPNCGALTDAEVTAAIIPGTGGLAGAGTLINVLNGVDYSYNAVALDDFSRVALWSPPGLANLTNLASVNPKTSNILSTAIPGQAVITSNWTGPGANPADPVSAVLMHNQIINEFVLDPVTQSSTDWVVTMPTKHFYVELDSLIAGARQNTAAQRPFEKNFGRNGACDRAFSEGNDREGAFVTSIYFPGAPIFIPVFCWETNVLTFNQTKLLGSQNSVGALTSFPNGWWKIDFTLVPGFPVTTNPSHSMISAEGVTYKGLPVVGFMVRDFVNGTLPRAGGGSVLSNYGGLFEHKYAEDIKITGP